MYLFVQAILQKQNYKKAGHQSWAICLVTNAIKTSQAGEGQLDRSKE